MFPIPVEEIFSKYDSKKDFTTLDAWKKTRSIRLFFHKEVLSHLPDEEKYNLKSQIRRACVSATANIAEGYGRYHYREATQFYRISRGSVYELKDHLITCHELTYVNEEIFNKGLSLIEEAKVTLNGFIKFVISQKKTRDE